MKFLSTYCSLCQKIIPSSQLLCRPCLAELPWNESFCTFQNLHGGLQILSPFQYKQPIIHFITQLKFQGKLQYANLLGKLLAKFIRKQQILLPEVIIPIPLHKKRLQDRGFNQALEIAKILSKKLKIPLDYSSCIRIKDTQAHSLLSAAQRKKNIKNAFHLNKELHVEHVAIVDDVVTTQQTVLELSKTLKKSGIKQIDVWCCARAALHH